MPEGDTVWRTATRLQAALAGKPIIESDLRWPRLATADLRGRQTLEVVSRGKHLLHRVEGGLTLHSHLRMEGQWRIEPTTGLAASWRGNPQLRALVAADDWTALGLRLGMLDLVETRHEDRVVGHLGPDVLAPDWEQSGLQEVATSRVAAAAVPIGQALLDQRNLAGVGTIWAAESLFALQLGPWVPAADLDRDTVRALVAQARAFIVAGTRGDAVASSIGPRRRGETTYVHGRIGRPCRRCGATVRVAMIGESTRERTMFYCPGCQGGLGPTDDGRPQAPLGAGARGPGRRR